MLELMPLADARIRAARRQAAAPSGVGAAAWQDVSVPGDGSVTVRMIVTDGTGAYRELDAHVPDAWEGVDVRDLEADVERQLGSRSQPGVVRIERRAA
jgi:hypothetical protein